MNDRQLKATEPDWIRNAMQKHHSWIESVLGVGIDQVIALRVPNNFTSLAARRLLACIPLAKLKFGPTPEMRQRVKAIEYPEGFPPVIKARSIRNPEDSFSKETDVWEIMWGDTPIAVRFEELRGAVIVFDLPYNERGCTNWTDLVICRQDEVAAVMQLVKESKVRQEGPVLHSGVHAKEIRAAIWDDLVLDNEVIKLVKNDYESFFAREEWFRSLKLPFRRGYLFHGQPGNGKTSVIRAMLSRPRMRGFTLNFFCPQVDDGDLEALFERAAESAPSMVIMEDIDRAFPKNQASGARSNVSLQQLLNCLDGVSTQDGVVVVATANEPTALDPAILRRPGRFDRVVLFPNPTAELRMQYFLKLNPAFSRSEVNSAVERSDGFSFAQLREAYILAGQSAFERGAELDTTDIVDAVNTLRRGFSVVGRRETAAGFRGKPTEHLPICEGPPTP